MTSDPADQRALDGVFMARAIAVAANAREWASPNPAVGCILVQPQQEIGAGFTQPAGQAHAEVMALQAAKDAGHSTVGATAYVTLEPCNHQGLTGPCSEALIAAGVTRVVASLEDPDPRVAGGGFTRLREAGIAVDVGLMAEDALEGLQGFFWRLTRGYGRVTLKLGISLDGKVAMASGESQWITGPQARADVQRLRAASCFVVTSSETVLSDNCALTVRPEELGLEGEALRRATYRQPGRVVLDRRARVPGESRVLSGEAETLLIHAQGQPAALAEKSIALPESGAGLDLGSVLAELGRRGANEILLEAGPRLAAAFLAGGWVDRVVLYQAPVLLGAKARSMVALELDTLAQAVRLDYQQVQPVGDDLRIIAAVKRKQ